MASKIPDEELPRYVRRCFDVYRRANVEVRQKEVERLKFYVGGDLQWRAEELEKRKAQQRPWVTSNRLKPAVDGVEGDIRMNPPGPQIHPVGGGADPIVADIMEGLIRETEYRSGARMAYAMAGRYSSAGGFAVLELATEWVSDRSFQQQLVINAVEDPGTVFFDPAARRANREDAMWAGKLKMYSSREDFVHAFGEKKPNSRDKWRVLETNATQQAMGWIQDAMGVSGDAALISEWTGRGKGPYFVAEFYHVEIEPAKLYKCSDGVSRFDDEPLPKGVKQLKDDDNFRWVGKRKIVKSVVDALEVHDTTEWLGSLIPLFPIFGPEVYIEGKLHRLSLISGALDSQRALNYVATTMVEVGGLMPKSPWIGPEGTFDDPRWQTSATEVWAYLEYKPIFAVDEGTGTKQLAQPPQRNQWEAPIQWMLHLAAWFADSIKAVTSVYDPSLGTARGDQSGKAIQQLRTESSVANFSYSDNLRHSIEIIYGEMIKIFPQIMRGPQVRTIVRADSQHQLMVLNQVFGPDDIDPGTGKPGKSNNLEVGQYAARAAVGPSFESTQKEAVGLINEFFQAAPQILAVPGVAATYLRMVGDGNPKVEELADLLEPGAGQEPGSPQEAAQLKQQNQVLTQLVQKLQQAIQAKLPEVEAKKFVASIQAIATIRSAEIKAGVDKSQQDLDSLEHFTGMAHEVGLQAHQHQHESQEAAADREHEAVESDTERMHESDESEAARGQESSEAEAGRVHEKQLVKAKPAPAKK